MPCSEVTSVSLVWRSPKCPLHRGPILEALNAIGIENFGPLAVSFVERSSTPRPLFGGPLSEVPLYYTLLYTYIVDHVSRCSPQ